MIMGIIMVKVVPGWERSVYCCLKGKGGDIRPQSCLWRIRLFPDQAGERVLLSLKRLWRIFNRATMLLRLDLLLSLNSGLQEHIITFTL
jgi:hypothetical protein